MSRRVHLRNRWLLKCLMFACIIRHTHHVSENLDPKSPPNPLLPRHTMKDYHSFSRRPPVIKLGDGSTIIYRSLFHLRTPLVSIVLLSDYQPISPTSPGFSAPFVPKGRLFGESPNCSPSQGNCSPGRWHLEATKIFPGGLSPRKDVGCKICWFYQVLSPYPHGKI